MHFAVDRNADGNSATSLNDRPLATVAVGVGNDKIRKGRRCSCLGSFRLLRYLLRRHLPLRLFGRRYGPIIAIR